MGDVIFLFMYKYFFDRQYMAAWPAYFDANVHFHLAKSEQYIELWKIEKKLDSQGIQGSLNKK